MEFGQFCTRNGGKLSSEIVWIQLRIKRECIIKMNSWTNYVLLSDNFILLQSYLLPLKTISQPFVLSEVESWLHIRVLSALGYIRWFFKTSQFFFAFMINSNSCFGFFLLFCLDFLIDTFSSFTYAIIKLFESVRPTYRIVTIPKTTEPLWYELLLRLTYCPKSLFIIYN